eukprot:2387227-Rhodomonas_salina.1
MTPGRASPSEMTYAVPISFDVSPQVQAMLKDAVTLAEITRERISASNSRLSHSSNLVMTSAVDSKISLQLEVSYPNKDRAAIELYALDKFDIRQKNVSDRLAALVMFYSEFLYRLYGDHQVHCFYANGSTVDNGDIPFSTQIESLQAVLNNTGSRVFKFYLQERAYLNLEFELDERDSKLMNCTITVRDREKWENYLGHLNKRGD